MSVIEVAESGVGVYGTAGDSSIVMYDSGRTSHKGLILALHGRSLTSLTWGPITSGTAYEHVRALVRAGYVVISGDAAGTTAWSSPAAMTAVNNMKNYGLTRFGGTKYACMGFSMGGLTALNVQKRDSACLGSMMWSPCTDLSWAYGPAGYTPAYGGGVSPLQATYQAEINTAFSCNTSTYATATNGYRIYDEYSTWSSLGPVKIIHADDDATVPIAQIKAFVNGVNAPQVSLHELASGGHGPWTGTDPSETASFFNSLGF
ncbi:MAG TPA: alpha/beta fold hydrolase [Candidatus Saccharimonadales bacterium]|nr:alpha/beta fold hydrolase [Candidatus Saccharimonadales bacterium]